MKNVLFISLDGMTDPLGQSQVLPYLAGLAEKGHRIFLISCEKEDRFEKGQKKIADFCVEKSIIWRPQPYLTRPRGIATWRQVRNMYREAVLIHKEHSLNFTHCRSYIPALVGLKLNRKKGIPFIFDMRGFWADERVEGGLWDVKKPWYQAAYRFMKRKEKVFLQEAARIVSLTEKGKAVMEGMGLERLAPITVIPCSVDLSKFTNLQMRKLGNGGGEGMTIDEQGITNKEGVRLRLGIESDALVFVYLGSVGSWYLLDEMLQFFQYVRLRQPKAHFLFISQRSADLIRQKAESIGLPKDAISIQSADREQIPALLTSADIGFFFIKPCFSKQASSPTKLGEMLAMGLPVIANSGVGDLDAFFAENRIGALVKSFNSSEFEQMTERLPEMLQMDRSAIRSVAEKFFALNKAIDSYHLIYQAQEIKSVNGDKKG